jgi:hypothetical protein
MPASTVRPYISDNDRRTRPRVDLWIPLAIFAALGAILLVAPTLQPGPFISRVTVVNHSEYAYDVAVSGGSNDGWMLLGTASERADSEVVDVYDQGSTWTFRFTTQGQVAGQISVRRADLERAGWKVVVPARFADALRAQEVLPTAPTK